MKLVRYEHPESALANGFDNWFRRMFGDFGSFANLGGGLAGAMNTNSDPSDVGLHADLFEADGAYHASFALPGLTKDDVKVELVNSVLTVSGEFSDTHGESERKMAFSRSLALPDGVDPGKISAEMRNGMLHITMSKTEERKPLAIDVK